MARDTLPRVVPQHHPRGMLGRSLHRVYRTEFYETLLGEPRAARRRLIYFNLIQFLYLLARRFHDVKVKSTPRTHGISM